jgi:branched-chain amino acid transport system permease protein
MLYRETGQFKTSYAADQQLFPIRQDRYGIWIFLACAFFVIPFFGNDYWLNAVLIPFLVFSLAALSLNLVTGYAGQLSLGTAAFMSVGAYTAYNFYIRVPGMPLLASFALGGIFAAALGFIFGLPSLRLKGFYLVVSTLMAQFFVEWALSNYSWFSFTNVLYNTSGLLYVPKMTVFGYELDSPAKRYLLALSFLVVLTLLAKNLMRSHTGRSWRAVRDMEIAADIVGINSTRAKLLAFTISSFYCGITGALYFFIYLGILDKHNFDLNLSFTILFMVIIGGMGSILGGLFGAAFITLFPIILSNSSNALFGTNLTASIRGNVEIIIYGSLVILFLIVEPRGLAQLWQTAKQKLRSWPLPPE